MICSADGGSSEHDESVREGSQQAAACARDRPGLDSQSLRVRSEARQVFIFAQASTIWLRGFCKKVFRLLGIVPARSHASASRVLSPFICGSASRGQALMSFCTFCIRRRGPALPAMLQYRRPGSTIASSPSRLWVTATSRLFIPSRVSSLSSKR
jgi:hypothetical protein